MGLEDVQAEVASLRINVAQHADRIRTLEKMMDTRATPLHRRVMFRVDGWPSWSVVASEPSWRPWRRWWRS